MEVFGLRVMRSPDDFQAEVHVFFNRIHLVKKKRGKPGVIIFPTQTMHHYRGNASKSPYICSV